MRKLKKIDANILGKEKPLPQLYRRTVGYQHMQKNESDPIKPGLEIHHMHVIAMMPSDASCKKGIVSLGTTVLTHSVVVIPGQGHWGPLHPQQPWRQHMGATSPGFPGLPCRPLLPLQSEGQRGHLHAGGGGGGIEGVLVNDCGWPGGGAGSIAVFQVTLSL